MQQNVFAVSLALQDGDQDSVQESKAQSLEGSGNDARHASAR
jgi:hypothetical protein